MPLGAETVDAGSVEPDQANTCEGNKYIRPKLGITSQLIKACSAAFKHTPDKQILSIFRYLLCQTQITIRYFHASLSARYATRRRVTIANAASKLNALLKN